MRCINLLNSWVFFSQSTSKLLTLIKSVINIPYELLTLLMSVRNIPSELLTVTKSERNYSI